MPNKNRGGDWAGGFLKHGGNKHIFCGDMECMSRNQVGFCLLVLFLLFFALDVGKYYTFTVTHVVFVVVFVGKT